MTNVGPISRNWADIRHFFSHHFILAFAAYALLFSVLIYGAEGILTLFLQKSFQVNEESLGHFGTLKSIGSLLGSIGAGFAVAKLSAGRTALIGVTALALCSFGVAFAPSADVVMSGALIWGFASGFSATGFVSLAMHLTPTVWAATIFSLFMAVGNIGGGLGDAFASRWATEIGFHSVFLLFAGVGLASVAALGLSLKMKHKATPTKLGP